MDDGAAVSGQRHSDSVYRFPCRFGDNPFDVPAASRHGTKRMVVGIYTILRIAFGVSFVYDLVMTSLNAENMRGYEEELAFALLAKYAIWLVVIGIYKIVLIVFMCMDSDIDENKYGKSPKYVDSDAQ